GRHRTSGGQDPSPPSAGPAPAAHPLSPTAPAPPADRLAMDHSVPPRPCPPPRAAGARLSQPNLSWLPAGRPYSATPAPPPRPTPPRPNGDPPQPPSAGPPPGRHGQPDPTTEQRGIQA